ncbi:MAG TPA: hypothetical protein ENI23_11705 [bacterium]|nr:hypothetical protein [bacterium]
MNEIIEQIKTLTLDPEKEILVVYTTEDCLETKTALGIQKAISSILMVEGALTPKVLVLPKGFELSKILMENMHEPKLT